MSTSRGPDPELLVRLRKHLQDMWEEGHDIHADGAGWHPLYDRVQRRDPSLARALARHLPSDLASNAWFGFGYNRLLDNRIDVFRGRRDPPTTPLYDGPPAD